MHEGAKLMPKYVTTSGRPVWINPLHVVSAEPPADGTVGTTNVMLAIGVVMPDGISRAAVQLNEPFTNFVVDMEAFEKGVRRGGLAVVGK
jgi:hypothetical protein